MATTVTRSNTKVSRLAAQMGCEIAEGVYPAGSMLPPERELARRYGVSPTTLRKCLGLLTDRGHLVRHPNRGVVVAERPEGGARVGQIAFVSPMLSSDAVPYIRGLTGGIDHDRFSLATYITQADMNQYRRVIENIPRTGPVGAVIWVPFEDLCPIHDECFAGARFPIVTLGQHPLPHVAADNVRDCPVDAAVKVARRIAAGGCRRPAFVGAVSRRLSEEQIQTLRRELGPHGIGLPDERVFVVDTPRGFGLSPDPYSDVHDFVADLLARGLDCDCLICGHDYPAVGALRALAEFGIRVPDAMKVISLCRTGVERTASPRLTTVDIHNEQQARKAAELLIRRIDGHKGYPEIHYVSTELIEGETA